MSRAITGTVRRIDGTAWGYARLEFGLLSDPATATGEVYPIWRKTVIAEADGSIPAGTLLETPETGSWRYRLRIEENVPLEFYLEQGDGSALTIDEVVTLAGQTGSEAGTPQNELLLALYDAAQDADANEVAEADGSGGVGFNGRRGVSADDAAWVAAGSAGGALGTQLAARVAIAGDEMTGQLKIQKDYTYGNLDSAPLRIIGSGQAGDASSWPLLELYNPASDDVGQYAGEAKLWIRAGNATIGNQRRYIHWRKHDNSEDDWIFGVNASDVRITYDASVTMHREWLIAGGDSYYNAAPGAKLRINFASNDEVGTGFRVYRGGVAAGNNYLFYIENGTPGSMDSSTLTKFNSGTASGPQANYFYFQDNDVDKFYFGKTSSNTFLIRDVTNSRNTFNIAANGRVGINDTAPVGMLHVTAPDISTRALVADVPTGNVMRILELTKNDVIQFAVENGGRIRTNQPIANTNTPSGATSHAVPLYDVAGALVCYVPGYAAQW